MSQARRSLILITVDCLRADHVGFLGYPHPTTPFQDSLAQQSTVFANAIVAGAPTYYSFPAIMASRPPLALGRDVIGVAPHEDTLASTLKAEGYATAAFLAGNPYLSAQFGYEAGFDTFRDHLDTKLDPLADVAPPNATGNRLGAVNRKLAALAHKLRPIGAAYDNLYFEYCQRVASSPAGSLDRLRRFPSADVIVDEAAAWLADKGDTPFFLWLHLMDAHSPYYPREESLRLITNASVDAAQARYVNSSWNRGDLSPVRLRRYRDQVISLYDAGIRWVDTQIDRLVQKLRELNVWDGSILAVTADHGEEFLDHGGRYHPPSRVHEELIRVPLLLRVPGTPPDRVNLPFSLVNLSPTLLDIVDVPSPSNFHGKSFWPRLKQHEQWGDAAIVECIPGCDNPFRTKSRLGSRIMAIRDSRFKLVLDLASSEDQMFDLEKDPKEMYPLPPPAEKSVRRKLLEIARIHIDESLQSRDPKLRLSGRLRDLQFEGIHAVSRASA